MKLCAYPPAETPEVPVYLALKTDERGVYVAVVNGKGEEKAGTVLVRFTPEGTMRRVRNVMNRSFQLDQQARIVEVE